MCYTRSHKLHHSISGDPMHKENVTEKSFNCLRGSNSDKTTDYSTFSETFVFNKIFTFKNKYAQVLPNFKFVPINQKDSFECSYYLNLVILQPESH